MHLEYDDILKRLGKPLWHGAHGVPRYDRFTPHLATVYGDHVALLEVECQSCGACGVVAAVWDRRQHFALTHVNPPVLPEPTMPALRNDDPWDSIGSFHYGDVPQHVFEDGRACLAGPTMNSVPRRVLEFWSRDHFGPTAGWVRQRQYEMELPPLKDESPHTTQSG